jgi:hypothetical protein
MSEFFDRVSHLSTMPVHLHTLMLDDEQGTFSCDFEIGPFTPVNRTQSYPAIRTRVDVGIFDWHNNECAEMITDLLDYRWKKHMHELDHRKK